MSQDVLLAEAEVPVAHHKPIILEALTAQANAVAAAAGEAAEDLTKVGAGEAAEDMTKAGAVASTAEVIVIDLLISILSLM